MSKTAKGILIAVVMAAAVGAIIWAVVRYDDTGRRGSGLSEDYNYDTAELAKVDPRLVAYRPAGQFPVGMEHAASLAVDAGGRIWVANEALIRVFSPEGQVVLERMLPGEHKPITCLSIQANRLYAAYTDKVYTAAIDVDDEAVWPTDFGKNVHITSVAADGEEVFLADWGNRQIIRCDAKGKVLGVIGKRDEAAGVPGFVVPSPYFDIAIDPNGNLRVADTGRHRIETYNRDGRYLESWGQPSGKIEDFLGCCNPCHFALMADGRFVTAEKGLPRVKIYDSAGRFECVVAPPSAFADRNRNQGQSWPVVAVAPAGAIIVLDPAAGVVMTFVKK